MKTTNKKCEDKNTLQNVLADLVNGCKWLKNDRLNLALSFQAMIGNFGASAVLGVFMYYPHYNLPQNKVGLIIH